MARAKHASKVTLPKPNPGAATVLAYLQKKFPHVATGVWEQRMLDGNVHWHDGRLITPHTPYQEQARVYYYREVASEPSIPFTETILYQDEHLLVAHKPHFLPLMPTGGFVSECLQHRLSKTTRNEHIQALHRLDRVTAGLVLFSTNPNSRAQYHALFTTRAIQKRYHAIAAIGATERIEGKQWCVQNRLCKSTPSFISKVSEGTPNSHSNIRCLAQKNERALFELEPITGRTHQLRVHMMSIGYPILNDRYYPTLQEKAVDNFDKPLQLLAKSLAFKDPLTGETRYFESPFGLQEGFGLTT